MVEVTLHINVLTAMDQEDSLLHILINRLAPVWYVAVLVGLRVTLAAIMGIANVHIATEWVKNNALYAMELESKLLLLEERLFAQDAANAMVAVIIPVWLVAEKEKLFVHHVRVRGIVFAWLVGEPVVLTKSILKVLIRENALYVMVAARQEKSAKSVMVKAV